MNTNPLENSIKIINAHQQQYYEAAEAKFLQIQLQLYSTALKKVSTRNSLKILDIGGAGGQFALALRKYFRDKNCEIFVLDSTQYDSWTTLADKVTFVKGSADNLIELFEIESFDLVFANRVFHHFVRNSWKKTTNGQLAILKQIAVILKKDGRLCIHDLFYNGFLYDKITSKIIYTLTSCTFSPVIALCKKLGAESSGVGVCFLSKKMWLNMFLQAGFVVETLHEDENRKWNVFRKVGLLIKSNSLNNVFILKK